MKHNILLIQHGHNEFEYGIIFMDENNKVSDALEILENLKNGTAKICGREEISEQYINGVKTFFHSKAYWIE